MSPPRFTHYELKLEGDGDIIAFLSQHLPATFPTRTRRRVLRVR